MRLENKEKFYKQKKFFINKHITLIREEVRESK